MYSLLKHTTHVFLVIKLNFSENGSIINMRVLSRIYLNRTQIVSLRDKVYYVLNTAKTK